MLHIAHSGDAGISHAGGLFLQIGFQILAVDLHPSFNQLQKEYGGIFRLVEEPISTSPSYFIFNLNSPELKKDVDGALKQLIDSGELSRLAIKDLGSDTTKNINK